MQIVDRLGAGGMGEVYRARDTRLGRIVAIKLILVKTRRTLKLAFCSSAKPRAIAALNHPRVCGVHDVGRHGAHDFLVMELLLDGETLEARLRRGLLALPELFSIASGAEALVAAHREGIIHRDLKPSNVMLTRNGVKLLDLGSRSRGSAVWHRSHKVRRRRSPPRLPSRVSSSAPSHTWHRSSWKAHQSMRARIFSHWGRCCSRWQPERARSAGPRRPPKSLRYSETHARQASHVRSDLPYTLDRLISVCLSSRS